MLRHHLSSSIKHEGFFLWKERYVTQDWIPPCKAVKDWNLPYDGTVVKRSRDARNSAVKVVTGLNETECLSESELPQSLG